MNYGSEAKRKRPVIILPFSFFPIFQPFSIKKKQTMSRGLSPLQKNQQPAVIIISDLEYRLRPVALSATCLSGSEGVYAYFSIDNLYRAFKRFGHAKFAYGGLILGSSQFPQLPQLPLKTMLDLKKKRQNL